MKKKKITKKAKPKKKVSPQRSTRHVVEVRVRAEQPVPSTAIVPAAPILPKDLEPIKEGRKLMIPATWVSERQASFIIQKTPAQYVKRRKGRGGQDFDYVPGHYFKRALNFGFGWNWDFFIDHQELVGAGQDWAQVITRGHLVVKDDKGHTITKSDVGKADVKYLRNSKTPMDLGNDFKASATDCLKRCAVQLGIASDVYGAAEMKAEGYAVREEEPRKQAAAAAPTLTIEAECLASDCAMPISKAEAEFSKKMFGKPLCREHQKEAKRI